MQSELMKFLLAYRATPKVTTGQSPAKLMFGRELKTKLPELRNESVLVNQGVRDRDWERKFEGKKNADEKRKAKFSSVELGEQVLVRNENKADKLAPNFEQTPYI